jgi:hypothetical protein
MKKKLTEAQLRKIIKEAVMNELNLMPNLGNGGHSTPKYYELALKMSYAIQPVITKFCGVEGATVHDVLDRYLPDMAKEILEVCGGDNNEI